MKKENLTHAKDKNLHSVFQRTRSFSFNYWKDTHKSISIHGKSIWKTTEIILGMYRSQLMDIEPFNDWTVLNNQVILATWWRMLQMKFVSDNCAMLVTVFVIIVIKIPYDDFTHCSLLFFSLAPRVVTLWSWFQHCSAETVTYCTVKY